MEPAVYGCEDNKIISDIVMFRLKTLTILGSKAESRIQKASAKLRNVFVKALLWC